MRKLSFILLLCTLTVSCGTSKEKQVSTGKDSKPAKSKKTVHSEKEFPYIEAFHKGTTLKLKGDVDGAIEAFNKCLEIKQDDAAYFALGQLYELKKDNAQAIQMLLKATALDPKNIWYTENLAILYYDTQQFDKATPYFKKLVDYQPTNLGWLYGYGDCLLRNGKIDESIAVLNRAESVMGINPSLSLEKYNLYMNLRKEKEAIAELERYLAEDPTDRQVIATLVDHYFNKGDYEKGAQFLKQLVAADPENGRAHLALGEIYRKKGKINDAFVEYKEGFKSNDVDIDTKMSLVIELQGTSLSTHKETLELIESMVLMYPESAKPYSLRGDFYMNSDKELRALEDYKKALQYEKKQFPIWNQVLLLEYQNGLWDDLYTDSKACLNYFTTMPMVYLLNGVSATKMKKFDEAIESLNIGKSLVVSDRRMEAEFLGQLAEAYFETKQFELAKSSYKDAIKLDPESNLLKNNFAYRLAQIKTDLELALSLINQAIAKSPNQSNYYDTRGWVYFQLNKFQEASNDFQKAIELDPTYPLFFEHLGDASYKLNKKEVAVENWTKAKELGSTSILIDKKIVNKTYYVE